MLHCSSLFCVLVAVLSGKCHLSLCIYMWPCLSYTISLLHHLWTLYRRLYVCEGGRSFSHPSPSDWQFNLIHRFHLLCFTSNDPDNTQMFLPFHMHVCVGAFAKCVCVCVSPSLVSLKPHLWAFVLFWANPFVNLLSAMFQTGRSRELKGMSLSHSLWYSALKFVLRQFKVHVIKDGSCSKQTWVYSLLSK